MIEVFERILRVGCGVTLESVLASARYAELEAAKATLMDRYPADTDCGVALRAGHLVFGRLINTMTEAEALKAAREQSSQFGHGIEYRPLIQIVGEELVRAAGRCLPNEVVEMARAWGSSDAGTQIEMAGKLFNMFKSTDQGRLGQHLTMEGARRHACERLGRKDGGEDCILPLNYGPWNADSCRANCQGKSQMLVAFARMAGARVMVTHPHLYCNDQLSALKYYVRDLVADDLRRRNLSLEGTGFDESFAASYIEEQSLFSNNFHVNVAVELADGRWVLLDPHCVDWGVIPEVWNMSEIYQLHSKYAEVLPGLEIPGNDAGYNDRLLAARLALAEDQLERSRRMQKLIEENVTDCVELAQLLAQSDDLPLFMRLTWAENGHANVADLDDPKVLEALAYMVAFGEGGRDAIWQAMLDPDFLPLRISSWLTTYHSSAINLFLNQLTESGELIHPACGFAAPEYELAVSAVNSVSIDRETPSRDVFFVDYSFDQTMLHNAMVNRSNSRLAREARETARVLPVLHPLCQRRLRW